MSLPDPKPHPPTVWFDSECIVCNRSMQLILKHEAGETLRFGALQTPQGQAAQATASPDAPIDSIIFQAPDGALYHSSSALLHIASYMKRPWRWLQVFKIIPTPLRDAAYRWFAKNRYRFGDANAPCPIPSPALRQRMR